MITDIFEKIYTEASRIARENKRTVLLMRDFQDATKLVLPGISPKSLNLANLQIGALLKHATAEGLKAVSKYNASLKRDGLPLEDEEEEANESEQSSRPAQPFTFNFGAPPPSFSPSPFTFSFNAPSPTSSSPFGGPVSGNVDDEDDGDAIVEAASDEDDDDDDDDEEETAGNPNDDGQAAPSRRVFSNYSRFL